MLPLVEYINNFNNLKRIADQLAQSDFVALDTEFLREQTYIPQLCLIQIANSSLLAIIDPLVLTNLTPLWEILANRQITKVLHAGRQDLEIFYEYSRIEIAPLFDTQIAANLLEYGEQISYRSLVAAECGVTLDKAYTRTNWAARPLTSGQLAYAADDVRYLAMLYPTMLTRLKNHQRLNWLTENLLALSNPQNYSTQSTEAWRRISGNHKLKYKQLIILQRLAEWRDQQARTENRPRRWIISDAALLALARYAPLNLEQLQRIHGIEPKMIMNYGNDLIKIITA